METYLKHLIIDEIFEIFAFITTALGFFLISKSFISINILDYIIVGFVIVLFLAYKIYSIFYINYANYKKELDKEKNILYKDYLILLSLSELVKNKKIKNKIKNNLRTIKKDIVDWYE